MVDAHPAVLAGVADRTCGLSGLRAALARLRGLVLAEQVHGVSVAAIAVAPSDERPISGCDALMTALPGLALVIKTADCLPITLWDPVHGAAAILHAGWRGVERRLPERTLRAMAMMYHTRPDQVRVGIGPAIRACCYDVGQEFVARFGPWVRAEQGRRRCDLIGCATDQLRAAGVPASRIADSGACTVCDSARWYSHRRSQDAGRLLSFVVLDPEGRLPHQGVN